MNSILNCEAYSSFEGVSYDHRIVSAKICLSLRRNTTQTVKGLRYDWSSLAKSEIRNQYIVTIRNKFDYLQETFERREPND